VRKLNRETPVQSTGGRRQLSIPVSNRGFFSTRETCPTLTIYPSLRLPRNL